MKMRILGVDPGQKNIGVAISDPSGTIANPHSILTHISRPIDAASIGQIAIENKVELIVVGQALDINGKSTLSGRRAKRLAAAIRTQVDIPVLLWDESNSTQTAKKALDSFGISRRHPRGLLDDLAATVILQSYLDSR